MTSELRRLVLFVSERNGIADKNKLQSEVCTEFSLTKDRSVKPRIKARERKNNEPVDY